MTLGYIFIKFMLLFSFCDCCELDFLNDELLIVIDGEQKTFSTLVIAALFTLERCGTR